MNPDRPSDRELEALSRQLRALAQQLVRDPGSADDLVQEAWLAALNRPREQLAELGAWLRVVVRNMASRRVRTELRRQDAELLRAEREETRETEEALERSNIALALRDAAHELPEPVRSVIVLHYFEGLTLEATAARLARPLETVRSQRKRGIEALRGVLDRRHRGARRDWLAALAPLLGWRPARAPRWRWAVLAGFASILFVGLGLWLMRTGSQEAATPALAALDGSRADPQLSVPIPEAPARADVASVEEPGAPPSEPAAAPAVETRRYSVRVTDDAGRVVAGARVSALGVDRSEQGPFFTDADGQVEFEVALDKLSQQGQFAGRGGLVLYGGAEGHARSLMAVAVSTEGLQHVDLALRGRAQKLVGVVLGPDGEPVANAYIDIENHVRDMQGLPSGVWYGDDPRFAWTDAQGRFEFPDLPRRTHRWLARGPELGATSGTVSGEEDELALVINLPRGRILRGVVASAGRPLAGAHVWVARGLGASIGAPRTTADAEGRYALKGISETPLRVFARAAAPDELSADEFVFFEDLQEEAELDLELQARPPLRLRFVAGDGAPLARAMVTLQTNQTEPAPWRQSMVTDDDGWATYADYASCPLVAQVKPLGAPGYLLSHDFDPRLSPVLELRVGEGEKLSSAPVRVRLVDPYHTPLTARVHAFSIADGQGISCSVDPRTGEVGAWFLPAGARLFYAVDQFGAVNLGSAQLDGASEVDLGAHTLGATRAIELVWPPAREGDDTVWSLLVAVDHCEALERMLELSHGRSRVDLRDGRYVLFGDSPQGAARVRLRFEVGPGQPVRVLVP